MNCFRQHLRELLTAAILIGAGIELWSRPLPQPEWGRIVESTNSDGTIRCEVGMWPSNGKLSLPTPFPNISAAYMRSDGQHESLKWRFDQDATRIEVELPATVPSKLPAIVTLETVESTDQFTGGRISFSALDAKVNGAKAKLESHPGNHRIGFWTHAGDSVEWTFRPTRWGMYDVELAFSADGGDGTDLQIEIGSKVFEVARPSTGSWYRYQVLPIGRIYLPTPNPLIVKVGCRKMTGIAAMNLKAVTLRPAPEGGSITQDASGPIILRASDATTHSTVMRYEPATNKNCLGYWVNAADWADWRFNVTKPATYEVEVWQGCGKGQGGSDVAVEVGGVTLPFVVEETGHFQIFLPRRIGRVQFASPGLQSLAIKPQRKQAGAIMDIREIRLIPIDPAAPPPRERADGEGPIDAAGRPLIQKLGTIDLDLVETTPVVFHRKLWRFAWVRDGYWNNQRKTNYFRFVNHDNGELTPAFADGHEFGSAFVDGDTMYVTGTQGRDRINVFASQDLKTWRSWPVINDGRYGIFNTSICKAAQDYVLMFEIDRPVEEAGTAFTARFARSRDLRTWSMTPPECNYAKDRYTAPHCLRWLDGWFYNFYLEAHNGYEMRVVRSRDLIHWESSPLNPVLRASPDDKRIANPSLNDSQRTRIAHAVNLNNSDLDFCEWQGRLVINYSWGNQQGVEHLAEARYDGTMTQFLQGWFPEALISGGARGVNN
jgi:hypothetical protein